MPTINIDIKNKIATADDTEYICGNDDFIVAFNFDAEWDEHTTKTARFVWDKGHQDIVFQGSQCEVPVISNTSAILCGVFTGNLKTTTPALIRARKSILCGNPPPAEATPTVFEQMLTLFNAGLNEIRKAAGETVAGKTFTVDGENVTAQSYAEIFNYPYNTATGYAAHAEGFATKATGDFSHAEGHSSEARGYTSHAEGFKTKALGRLCHAEGDSTVAEEQYSHTEGRETIARGLCQHVQGRFNKPLGHRYLHVVGNGASDEERSNAHTLDEDGNAWFAGTVECATCILKSPDGTRFKITVNNDGTLAATAVNN